MREKTKYDFKKQAFYFFARAWEHHCPECEGVLVIIEEESGIIDRHSPEFRFYYEKWTDIGYFGKKNFVWEVFQCRKCGKESMISATLLH